MSEEFEAVGVQPYRSWSPEEVFELEPPEWLMEYVLPKGGSTLLYGPTNVGKSLVALDWAFRLASGYNWLDRFVANPVRVMYVYAEGGHDLQLRYQAWCEGNAIMNTHRLEENIQFLGLDEEVHLRWPADADDAPEGVLRLWENAKKFKPEVIVFDPAQEVWRGMDSNSDRDVQMAYRVIKDLQRQHGCAALIVHHARKDGDTFRGATTWADLADVCFSISESNYEGILELKNTKTRYAQKGHQWRLQRAVQTLERVPKLLGQDSVYISAGRRHEEASLKDDLVGRLTIQPLGYAEIGRALFSDPNSSRTAKLVASLEEEGLIYKETGRLGKYRLVSDRAEEVDDL